MIRLTAIAFTISICTTAYASDECGTDFICFKRGQPTAKEAANFQLPGDSLRIVKAHAAYLNKHPEAQVTLTGYTTPDECGTSCDALAQRRAQVAHDALASLGIAENRMSIHQGKDVIKINNETLKRHPDDAHSAIFYMHD